MYNHQTLASSVNPQFNFALELQLEINDKQLQLIQAQLPSVGASLHHDEDEYRLNITEQAFRAHLDELPKLSEQLTTNITGVLLNGESVSAHQLSTLIQTVQDHERVLHKHAGQDPLERKEGWGAPQLRKLNRYLPKHEHQLLHQLYWFQVGEFVEAGVWRINKSKILQLLKQEAEEKFLFLAPSFNFQQVSQIVHRLPDVIDTRQKSNWEVWERPIIADGHIEQQPVGLIHQSTQRGAAPAPASQQQNQEEQNEQTEERTRFIPNVSFDEIGGLDDLIQTVREVIELPLRCPEMFEHMGITPHKGIMLHGPPGCGKTMIAKAIANDIQAHFISVKGPELLNKYYGQSEENIRELFEEAREMQPAIIFFDEMDAIAQSRSSEENLRMDARIVNQLLTLLDGVEDYGQVCVIAATNRVELIDDALLRPGRFDYSLEIPRPDQEGCQQIFTIATDDMPVSEQVDREAFSKELLGLTGADITFVAREGAYNCLRRHVDLKQSLSQIEFDQLNSQNWKITLDDFKAALAKLRRGKNPSSEEFPKS
ncbi:MAG: ATP-binding protein [Bacteroidota bacterium]